MHANACVTTSLPRAGLLRADMAGRGRGANPLAHVLQALDEPLDLLTYKNWNVMVPGGCAAACSGRGPQNLCAARSASRLALALDPSTLLLCTLQVLQRASS